MVLFGKNIHTFWMFLMFCFCSPQVSSFSWKDEELRHKKYKLREFRGTEISEYPFDGKKDKCVHITYKNMKLYNN